MEQTENSTNTQENKEIKSVVVLAMHSSGSSCLASILDALGVQMNYNPRAKVRWYTNYEDSDFVKLNCSILARSGGDWKKAPNYERVARLSQNPVLTKRIKGLVKQKTNGVLWGFKDPRTALTIQLIHPYLVNPGYIRVVRPYNDIAQSIMKRGGSARTKQERWIKLAKDYNYHINRFLDGIDAPVLVVPFNKLLDTKQSRAQVKAIADFLGINKNINKAVARINYNRK